jgi:DNA (cytosine-5)-methyltransferase 1
MSRTTRILDLFCGEGGAGFGYQLAGCEVIGVDLRPHPRCPFPVIVCDALQIDRRWLDWADAFHASPPCQGLTEMNNDKSRHPNLIPAIRRVLIATGKPYSIENVRGARAHLIDPVSLTGLMFDNHMVTSAGQRFDLSRERLFETNWGLSQPWLPRTTNPLANVFGGHLRARSGKYRTGNGADGKPTGRTRDFVGEDKPALARRLMGMPWASMTGMSEAVPPSYTEYIAAHLSAALEVRLAA